MHRFFRTRLDQIAYLRFVVESYEGLALVTSYPGRGELEWTIPAGLAETADALAAALGTETDLTPIPRPDDWPEG